MHNERRSVGTTGIPGGLPYPVGIGYVFIPYGVEREDYIKTCYQTNTVALRTEGGDFFKNVPVPDAIMTDIVFPEDVALSNGSVVAFAVIPKHNAPVVFAVLGLKDALGRLVEEGQFKVSKSMGDNSAGIDIHTKGSPSVSVAATGAGSKITFKVASNDEDSKFEVLTKGDVEVYGSKHVRVFVGEEVSLELVDEKLEPIAHIRYNKDTKIWQIFGDSGSDGQPAILGDDWIEKAEKICDLISDFAQAVSTMTVGVLAPQSPSGPPVNPAPFVQVKTQITQLKQQLKDTLSKRVKID